MLFLSGTGGEELGPGKAGPICLGGVLCGIGGAGDGGLGPNLPVTLACDDILSSWPAGCCTVVDPPGPVVVVVVVVVY